MISGIGGGVLMWAVHFLSKAIPAGEYGLFGALMAVGMCIPAMPLQMILAQQTAKAIACHREGELSGMIRLLWRWTFVLWFVGAVVVLIFQESILKGWEASSPAGLWLMLPVLLLSIWGPMFGGILQGQQNFLWLGWSGIFNAFFRLSVAAFAVLALGGRAAGMVTGVLVGAGISQAIAFWQTRSLWLLPPLPFDWRGLLRQVIPLVLACAAFQFLFTADTMFVKTYFSPDEVGFYVGAGTLSRALMWLVGPLATVMFPRIVHHSAKAEKTDLMGLVLLGTAIMAVAGAICLSVLGPWIIKLVYKQSYVAVASAVLPWYAAAMVPLALANVLLNNLMARSLFRAVPALCLLAVAYGLALTHFHHSLVSVLKTCGVFNLLLLAVCASFTWVKPSVRCS